MAAAMAAGEAETGDGAGWLGVMAERCPVHGRRGEASRRKEGTEGGQGGGTGGNGGGNGGNADHGSSGGVSGDGGVQIAWAAIQG